MHSASGSRIYASGKSRSRTTSSPLTARRAFISMVPTPRVNKGSGHFGKTSSGQYHRSGSMGKDTLADTLLKCDKCRTNPFPIGGKTSENSSNRDTIGGPLPGQRNVISQTTLSVSTSSARTARPPTIRSSGTGSASRPMEVPATRLITSSMEKSSSTHRPMSFRSRARGPTRSAAAASPISGNTRARRQPPRSPGPIRWFRSIDPRRWPIRPVPVQGTPAGEESGDRRMSFTAVPSLPVRSPRLAQVSNGESTSRPTPLWRPADHRG